MVPADVKAKFAEEPTHCRGDLDTVMLLSACACGERWRRVQGTCDHVCPRAGFTPPSPAATTLLQYCNAT